MKTLQTLRNKQNRRAIIKIDDLGYYITTCFINGCDIAPAHPPKEYKTLEGAKRYANKFLKLS